MDMPLEVGQQDCVVTAIVTCMSDSEASFIGQAIRSVRTQTCPVVLRVYIAEDNDWFEGVVPGCTPAEIRRIPRQNVASVRNLGVREANTPYVAFLDGDDWWLPRKTETQLAALRAASAVFAGMDHYLVDESGVHFANGFSRYLPMTSSWLVERAYMLSYPFDETVSFAEDGYWWIRTLTARGHKLRVPDYGIAYRVRKNSKSKDSPPRRRKLFLLKATRTPLMRYAIRGLTHCLNALGRADRYIVMRHWPHYPPPEPVRPAAHDPIAGSRQNSSWNRCARGQ